MPKKLIQPCATEIVIGPYSSGVNNYAAPCADVLSLLDHAGVDVADCLFSGYASSNGLAEKEQTDFDQYKLIPDEASDDALLIFYGSDITSQSTNNPLWYAFSESSGTGEAPRLDVYSRSILNEVVLPSLITDQDVWITPKQLKAIQLGTFVIRLSD